jgi:hypothetical protein
MNNSKEKYDKVSEAELQLRRMVDAYAEDVINGKMKFYQADEDENDEDVYEAYSIKYVVDQDGRLGFWGGIKYTKGIYNHEYIIDYFDEMYSCLK